MQAIDRESLEQLNEIHNELVTNNDNRITYYRANPAAYNPAKLDSRLTQVYQGLIRLAIGGQLAELDPIKLNLYGLYAAKFRTLGNRQPEYQRFITTQGDLINVAQNGKPVLFDQDLPEVTPATVLTALDILTKGQYSKNAREWKKLTLYPIQNFQDDIKRLVLYPLLCSFHPELWKFIKKNKVKLYISSDMEFAVDFDFRNVTELSEMNSLLHQNFYQKHDNKIYCLPLFDQEENSTPTIQ